MINKNMDFITILLEYEFEDIEKIYGAWAKEKNVDLRQFVEKVEELSGLKPVPFFIISKIIAIAKKQFINLNDMEEWLKESYLEYLPYLLELRKPALAKYLSPENKQFVFNKFQEIDNWPSLAGYLERIEFLWNDVQLAVRQIKKRTLFHENEKYRIYKVDDYDDMKELGAGTKWCVTNINYFNKYRYLNDLYVILPKTPRVYKTKDLVTVSEKYLLSIMRPESFKEFKRRFNDLMYDIQQALDFIDPSEEAVNHLNASGYDYSLALDIKERSEDINLLYDTLRDELSDVKNFYEAFEEVVSKKVEEIVGNPEHIAPEDAKSLFLTTEVGNYVGKSFRKNMRDTVRLMLDSAGYLENFLKEEYDISDEKMERFHDVVEFLSDNLVLQRVKKRGHHDTIFIDDIEGYYLPLKEIVKDLQEYMEFSDFVKNPHDTFIVVEFANEQDSHINFLEEYGIARAYEMFEGHPEMLKYLKEVHETAVYFEKEYDFDIDSYNLAQEPKDIFTDMFSERREEIEKEVEDEIYSYAIDNYDLNILRNLANMISDEGNLQKFFNIESYRLNIVYEYMRKIAEDRKLAKLIVKKLKNVPIPELADVSWKEVNLKRDPSSNGEEAAVVLLKAYLERLIQK